MNVGGVGEAGQVSTGGGAKKPDQADMRLNIAGKTHDLPGAEARELRNRDGKFLILSFSGTGTSANIKANDLLKALGINNGAIRGETSIGYGPEKGRPGRLEVVIPLDSEDGKPNPSAYAVKNQAAGYVTVRSQK